MRAWFERLSTPEKVGVAVLLGGLFGVFMLLLSKRTASSTTATTGAAANNLGTVSTYDPSQAVPEGALPDVPQTINVTIQPTPVSSGQTPTPIPPAPGSGAGAPGGPPSPGGTPPPGVPPQPPVPPEVHPPIHEWPPVSPDPRGDYAVSSNGGAGPFGVRSPDGAWALYNWPQGNWLAPRANPVVDPVSALTHQYVQPPVGVPPAR